ncbi:hypothetical protein vBRpoPV13_28 [Ruegeria phage vB_RpoP-V13]|uniref:Uncharacterized protein n=1 Tax=Ruegeria phage vB_RpoP-V13 TaxID=2218612 RepID=A0A2Z4QGK6_9CAUD|nr:hypothetical protein HYP63_gp28 [Ruegeria phage vB_RpoP-V13]AWY09385.1 hypothetical protein vBRpoPV13_28 [Ruegeria phage vB_RpoP-V13]
MTDVTLNAVFGPRYEIVIANDIITLDERFNLTLEQREPLRLNVGTGFNATPTNNSGTLDVTIIAQQVVNAYRAVGYDGLFTQPNADSLSRYAGVTRMATVIGDPIDVVRQGLMTEAGWNWTPNQPVFISANGVITQTVPVGTPIRRIGWAISATELNLDPYPIIGV